MESLPTAAQNPLHIVEMSAKRRRTRFAADSAAAHALNRASYDSIAAAWDSARTTLQPREVAFLDALLEGLEPRAEVLDLGCGSGRPLAAEILARGHRVTGVDQAEALLALARRRYPDGNWILGAVESFAAAQTYRAIVCWDALFHIHRSLHALLLGRMVRMLAPGGRLMLTVGGSEHPAFTDTMFGRRFFYDSYPPGKVLEVLVANGLRPVLAEYLNLPAGGRDKGRYAVVVEKP